MKIVAVGILALVSLMAFPRLTVTICERLTIEVVVWDQDDHGRARAVFKGFRGREAREAEEARLAEEAIAQLLRGSSETGGSAR